MTRIAIHGAAGRMGQRLVALVAADDELTLAAAIDAPDHPRIGEDAGMIAGAGQLGVPLSGTLDAEVDLVIDSPCPRRPKRSPKSAGSGRSRSWWLRPA